MSLKKIFHSFLFVFAAFGIKAQSDTATLQSLQLMLKKAKVATFYSATYSNGWDELQLAKSYTDSAENILNQFSFDDSSLVQERAIINGLREEHAVSEAIAVDNVNYKYPASSLMSGHRQDFIIKDDAEELLVESLIEKVLSQNDPLNKGKISENIDYLVFQIAPYNQTLLLVASDFLATQSGHYVIRHHEFAEILGVNGLERFKNDELTIDDWNSIFDYYGIDKILNLKVMDQGSIIPGLFYKGISINAVEKGSLPEYIGYFEGFKVDKISSWDKAALLIVTNFMLILIGLFLMMGVKFTEKKGRGLKLGKYNAFFFINWETAKETAIIGVVSILTALGVQYLGNQLAPDINAFYQDSSVRIWVLFQSFVPFVASALITYLVMFKLPNIIVNNSNGYARILFGSWMAQLAVLSYYEYHAELFPDHFWVYVDFIPSLGLIFLSALLGSLLNRIFKKEKVSGIGYVLLVMGFLFALLSFWLELRELFLVANLAYSFLAVFSIWMLYNPKRMGAKVYKMEEVEGDSASGLSNPVKWYTRGLNVQSLQEQLFSFLSSNDISDQVYVIQGNSGSGKTRFLKEAVDALRTSSDQLINIRWFQGDCNQVLEGTAPLYEPFYEAFTLNGEQINIDLPKELRCLPQGFFTDRSQLSKAFGKVVSQAGAVAPVDLASLLSVEDESSRSLDEIVSELLDSLINQYIDEEQNKIVLVIDDFHWIDSASYELLSRFVNKTKQRSKYTKYFKFIFTIANDQESESGTALNKILDLVNGEDKNIKKEVEPVSISITDSGAFVQEILSETTFKIEKSRSANFRFGPLLKHHLSYLISKPGTQFVPGDFLGYLEALEQKGFIKFDGDVIRLVQEPQEDEIGLQDSRKSVLKTDFEALSIEGRTLLESAAIVGYKFDAELLARIWNKDLLDVLAELEKLEGSFVRDLSQEDNIYSFTSKTMYRVILESANRKRDDAESRQLIIEYQKRIIKTIIEDNKDGYVEGLDLDMLLSASERCFRYSHVKYINDNAALIVLHAAKKLAIKGKRGQSIEYLKRLYARYNDFNARELLLIAQAMTELTKVSRLTHDFEFTQNDELDVAFIDHVFNRSRQNTTDGLDYENDSFALISILQMGGVMQFVKDVSKNKKEADVHVGSLTELCDPTNDKHTYFERLVKRYKIVHSLMTNGQIQNEKAQSRLAFYNHIATNGDPSALPNLFKNALTVGYPGLAGEIGREIYFSSGFDEVKRLKYLFASLELLGGADVTIEKIESYEVNKPKVEKSIDKLIKAKNLTPKEAQDFNFLLSRFREYFFKLKDFDYVITLCDITMELSKRLNDGVGITLSYSYKGAALFQLKRYMESEKIYEAYFEHTIRSTRDVHAFLYPLEGILRNAKESNDLSLYNRAKSDLYEHLIILEKSAIDKELQHSLFDKESAFSKLLIDLPEPEVAEEGHLEEDVDNVSSDIIRILVAMAAADGVIDENEKYDLREAAIAISHSLNLSRQVVSSSVEEELKVAEGRSFEITQGVFLDSCHNVITKRSKGYLESVIQLCSDMAMADDTLAISEKKLLDQSRQLLTKE